MEVCHLKRHICALFTLMILISMVSPSAMAKEKIEKPGEKQTSELAHEAKSAILMERDTGKVLYNKNSDEKLACKYDQNHDDASHHGSDGSRKLKMTDKVRTSDHAASMGGSQIFLEPGEEMTVKDMLKGIAIASGNDASVAMAEHIAGSEEQFVEQMNKRQKSLDSPQRSFKIQQDFLKRSLQHGS